jgi:uncharacterized zinc-type alcohol dehydrogenase-like protein
MIKAYAANEPGGELKPFEYDPGQLGANQVEIDVEHCGICHSDLSMLNNDWTITAYPFVPGHEVIGTVGQVGDTVTHLAVGQRVGLGWHAGYCMTCSQCLGGDQHLCPRAEGTIVQRHGGFADKVRADAISAIPLPDGVDAKTAGPLFCGGITVFSPLLIHDVKPTDRVAVIGIGGLGHMALKFIHAWGCEVTAFTTTDAKRDEALDMGAHDTLNSRDAQQLEAAAGRFDMIISTVNVKLDWNAYIATLAPKGKLHFAGVTLDPVDLAVMPMIAGQKSATASPTGSPKVIAQMLDFCARHRIEPVTEHFAFDRVNDAIEHLKSGKARYRVVLSR